LPLRVSGAILVLRTNGPVTGLRVVVNGHRYLTLAVGILLGGMAGFVAARGAARKSEPRATTESDSGEPSPAAGTSPALAHARELASLKQQIVEQLRAEEARKTRPTPPRLIAADDASSIPRPAAAVTAQNLDATRRADDMVGHAEATGTWSRRDRAELYILLGQMDPEARQRTMLRLAQGINAQRIVPAVGVASGPRPSQ